MWYPHQYSHFNFARDFSLIFTKLAELIGQRSTNLHVAGLSAIVIGLCLHDDGGVGQGIDSIIMQKIGVDKYEDSLAQIVKSEDFVNAEQGKVLDWILYHMEESSDK